MYSFIFPYTIINYQTGLTPLHLETLFWENDLELVWGGDLGL